MRLWGTLAAGLCAACSTSNPYAVAQTHGANSGRASASTSGSSGTTSDGTSSGGSGSATGSTSSSGGSSGTTGASCPSTPISELDDCGDAGLEVRGTLYTFGAQGTELFQQSAVFYDVENDFSSTSQPCGDVYICEPPGRDFYIEVQAAGNIPELVGNMNLQQSEYFVQLLIVPDEILQALEMSLPNFDVTEPVVFVNVFSEGNLCPLNGWTFTLTDVDGGAVSSQIAYNSGVDLNAMGPTTPTGTALIYNVDPNLQQFRVGGVLDPTLAADLAADGGPPVGSCSYDGGIKGLTGIAHVGRAGGMAYFPFVLP